MKSVILFFFLFILSVMCNPNGERTSDFMRYDESQYERVSINYNVNTLKDTTLVFIHGWNLDHTYWDYQVSNLKKQYTVITLDLAGHGNSGRDRTHWTVENFARDVVNIISREKAKNVILIGHSFGGEIALEIFNEIPDKVIGIIGVDCFKDLDFSITPEFEQQFKEYYNKFKRNYEEMSDALVREHIRSKDREVINRIVKDYKKADPKIALPIYKNIFVKYEEDRLHLGKLPFPVKIIGSSYHPYNEEALKKYAPHGYQLYWVYDAGHFPMVEQPEQFLQLLRRAIKEI